MGTMKGTILLLHIIIFEFWMGVTVAQVITADDPDLRNGGFVCPRVVTFTCVTTGSPTITWSSDQYIGTGNAQLTFAASINVVGDAIISKTDDRNIAIFTQNKVNTNGERELESILRLYILPNLANASISCGQTSFYFNVIADPGPPRELNAEQQQLLQYDPGSCIVKASWKNPIDSQSISDYMVSTNGTNLRIDITVDAMHDDDDDENAKLSTSWLVPNCAGHPHNIGVIAINICGRTGPERSTVTTLDSRPIGGSDSVSNYGHNIIKPNNVMIVKCSCALLAICMLSLLIMMLS